MQLRTLIDKCLELHPSALEANVELLTDSLSFTIDAVKYEMGVVQFLTDDAEYINAFDEGYAQGKSDGIEQGREDAARS